MREKGTRRRFTREFKQEAVRQIVREDRTHKQVAEELGLNLNVLGRWVKEFRTDPNQSFPGQGNLKARDKEVEGLRRENSRLKGELSFLKKVSAYFVKGQR
jgi:transposase